MEELTERQKNILEIVIREYIENALPISSKYLEEEYEMGVSPATIRGELYTLIEKGYLYQPHTSSGRVPTDKGYRFFVDLLNEKEIRRLEGKIIKEVQKMQEEIEGRVHFMREFTRFLAHTSSGLSLSYFPKESILLKEGWEEVLNDPEFDDAKRVRDFMGMVSDFEENIDFFFSREKPECIQVYIGSEAPFLKKHDFSILIASCRILKKKGMLAILGPKRMAYEKNIYLVESIIKMLEKEK
jgi:transcriptional regulator of heat shock response